MRPTKTQRTLTSNILTARRMMISIEKRLDTTTDIQQLLALLAAHKQQNDNMTANLERYAATLSN